MNRILTAIILIISCCAISYAQPKALGLRGGASGTEVSYQHYLSQEEFLSVDAGVDFGYNISGKLGAHVNGSYNFIWASPKWTKKGIWNIYAGPGVSAG